MLMDSNVSYTASQCYLCSGWDAKGQVYLNGGSPSLVEHDDELDEAADGDAVLQHSRQH